MKTYVASGSVTHAMALIPKDADRFPKNMEGPKFLCVVYVHPIVVQCYTP